MALRAAMQRLSVSQGSPFAGAARSMTSLKLQMAKNRPRHKKSRSKPEVQLFKWFVKKHDLVEVNQGPEEGTRGLVLDRQWENNTLTVEGVQLRDKEEIDVESTNIFSPNWISTAQPQPIHFSHVSLIDPTTNQRTDVMWKRRDGRMARVSLSSGEVVPLPVKPADDSVMPKKYAEDYVTRQSDVLDVTFVPLPDHSLRRARHAADDAVAHASAAEAEDEPGASSSGMAAASDEQKGSQERTSGT